jgi:molybdopterin molybdotransferase
VFGLPGNPMSSFVCFELFVRPAIMALAGRGFMELQSVEAKLTRAYEHTGGRAACLPARVALADQVVEILPWQGSADLATVVRANGLARVSADKGTVPAGTRLEVLLI